MWFVSGGSEATENAAKLARQYWLERGKPSKSIVIGRWQSFHGNTMGSMAFGGHTIRRRKYVPMFNEASHLPPMYCYRCHFKQTYPACDTYCADYLERLVRMQGSENVAAFIAEPVVGATLGAVPPVPEYFPKIREICDRNEILFIADEVMTGFGRTGANFAVDHWGVVPDLIATAKGVSGGYIPLGAVIVRDEIIQAFEKNNSNFVGGHTYSGHPVAAAVGLAVLRYIQEHDLVRNAREVGAHLLAGLRGLQARHPIIGDVRGLGMMVGLEFVADRRHARPVPGRARGGARDRAGGAAAGARDVPWHGLRGRRPRGPHEAHPAAHPYACAGRRDRGHPGRRDRRRRGASLAARGTRHDLSEVPDRGAGPERLLHGLRRPRRAEPDPER